jgi:hypothetical protein
MLSGNAAVCSTWRKVAAAINRVPLALFGHADAAINEREVLRRRRQPSPIL